MSAANLIETVLVVLGDNLSTSGQAFSLSANAPTIIRAWRVEVRGLAKSGGQDVTIIANQVEFFGPDGAIDSSGNDAAKQWAPGNKPLTPGQPANNGPDGQAGADGTDAGNVSIYAAQIKGTVTVRALGGAGGRGRDAGDGSPGGPYIGPDGGTSEVRGVNTADVQSRPCPPPTGHEGQQGGRGGKAGSPGKCGRGGNLDIWIPINAPSPTIEARLNGGSAPQPAAPGNPGQGGPGGPGGYCYTSFPGERGVEIRSLGSHQGAQGPQGKTGAAAEAQSILPAAGADGLLNGKSANSNPSPPCHVLTDLILSANCSVPQLWSILTAAETHYLNDSRFGAATPQLLWVAAMAKLLAPAMPDSGH